MKFGKRLRFLMKSEWKEGYMDYKRMKQVLKKKEGRDVFQQVFDQELIRVNAFYQLQLTDIESFKSQLSDDLPCLITLSTQVDHLRRFIILNALGFTKIIKKAVKAQHIDVFSQKLSQQSFCKATQLNSIYTEIIQLLNQIQTPTSTCAICLGTVLNPVTIVCQHTFCFSCLSVANRNHFQSCPICRQDLSLDPRDYEIDGLLKYFLTSTPTPQAEAKGFAQAKALAKFEYDKVQAKYTALNVQMPYVIAHRGASGTVGKGNTLAAFEKAVEIRVDMIELDVQLCKSGEIIVFHDVHLETGEFIRNMRYSELRQYDSEIPTLTQVLQTVRSSPVRLYLDLKCADIVPVLMAFLEERILNDGWDANRFLIASFNHSQLRDVKQYKSIRIETIALISCLPVTLAESFQQLQVSYVAIDFTIVSQEFIQDAKSRGIKIILWTINHELILAEFLNQRIDGIVTDYPQRLKKTREQQRSKYKIGDVVEFMSPYYPERWYPGTVVAKHPDESYGVLYWPSPKSQRRITCSKLRQRSSSCSTAAQVIRSLWSKFQ